MESKLKLQKDLTAQVIIQIDEACIVMDGCKIFANPENDDDVIFQLQDPTIPSRTVQITLTKVMQSEPVSTT